MNFLNKLNKLYSTNKPVEVNFHIDDRKNRHYNAHKKQFSPVSMDISERIIGMLKSDDYKLSRTINFIESKRIKTFEYLSVGKIIKHTFRRTLDKYIFKNNFNGFKVSIDEIKTIRSFEVDNPYIVMKQTYTRDVYPWIIVIEIVLNSDIYNVKKFKKSFIDCDDINNQLRLANFVNIKAIWNAGSSELITLSSIYSLYKYILLEIDHQYQYYMIEICELINKKNIKKFETYEYSFQKLVPKAIEVNFDKMKSSIKSLYVAREKIDGIRTLLLIRNGEMISVNSRSYEVKTIGDEYADIFRLYDTEYKDGIYYILHILIHDNIKLFMYDENVRLSYMNSLDTTEINMRKTLGISVCPFRILDSLSDLNYIWETKRSYYKDGVLISDNNNYWKQKTIKWKDSKNTSIDFLVVKCPTYLVGKRPYLNREDKTMYLLFVGCNAKQYKEFQLRHIFQYKKIFSKFNIRGYFPIAFNPQMNNIYVWYDKRPDLHGKIVELNYIGDEFVFNMIRTDRPSIYENGTSIGNNYLVALDTYNKMLRDSSIHLKDVWELYNKNYLFEKKVAPKNNDENIPKNNDENIPKNKISEENSKIIKKYNNCHLLTLVEIDFIPKIRNDSMLLINVSTDDIIPPHAMCVSKDSDRTGEYAAGADLVISGIVSSGIIFLKRINQLVSYGGTLVDVSGIYHEILDDVKYGYINKGNNVWYRRKQGRTNMTVYEVHNNNPHTIDNPKSNFTYKYMRCKTTRFELEPYNTLDLDNVIIDINRGKLLCYIEFLSETEIDRIYVHMKDKKFEYYVQKNIKRLFPNMEILTETADLTNVEVLITDDMKLHSRYNPIYVLYNYKLHDYIPRGKKYYIPYSDPKIVELVIAITKNIKMDRISQEIFTKEMECFNYVYRPSCYLLNQYYDNYDNCYDCKTEIFVWEKYCRIKNTHKGNPSISTIDDFITV